MTKSAEDSAARESARPIGVKSVIADGTGLRLSLPWSTWAAIIALLFGGGGSCVWLKFVTADEMDAAIITSEKKQAAVVELVEKEVATHGTMLGELSTKIGTLQVKVNAVQLTQHLDIAVREARRVVDDAIRCRRDDARCKTKKDDERERIRRVNMRRLGANPPKEPCVDLSCS